MHFSFVIAVVLLCLTVGCNGQFKILGLLDTKSEVKNDGQVENVENIRALVDVGEQFPADRDALKIIDEETVKASQSVDMKKENVNFIKPYESVTTEWNRDVASGFTEAHVVQNSTTNDVQLADKTIGKNASDREGGASESISERNVASISESSTIRPTTTNAVKAYRKTLRPNIRKFNHIEARSYHHADSPNHVTQSSRFNYQYVKVLKNRNKYKSKYRCERIWNCPRIQISIQRCEPDYFMCCF